MKLEAASRRGTKKDFVDIYFLLKEFTLAELLGFMEEKYRATSYNYAHLLRSLTYFDDAEKDGNIQMIVDISWSEVKNGIRRKVRDYMDEQSGA